MPSPNTLKIYSENSYYHIYNRGVEKRLIFHDREDYSKFIYLLKIYLTNPDELRREFPLLRANIVRNNLSNQLDLLAFCLMPNHFHLVFHQTEKNSITKLMRQIITAYSMYFNKRHDRIGPLFQSVYKAAPIETDEYLLHLTRYVHLNPLARGASLDEFEWSSYLYYLGKKDSPWLNIALVSEYFNNSKKGFSYKEFVENYIEPRDLPKILTMDNES